MDIKRISLILKFNPMKKTIFLSDRWVKFTFNKKICIGVTYLQFKPDKNDPENHFVCYISNERKTNSINFYQCVDLTYLQFVMKPKQIKELTINNKALNLESQIDLLICPNISDKTMTVLANNINNQLFMN